MDTSETYIKMCKKAEEIQKTADTWWDNFSYSFWREGMEHTIWLPRQDQLQEMITEHFNANNVGDLHQYLNIFVEWFTSRTGDYRIREVKTYEQLWLAFVMRERFGKIWSNGDWVLLPVKD